MNGITIHRNDAVKGRERNKETVVLHSELPTLSAIINIFKLYILTPWYHPFASSLNREARSNFTCAHAFRSDPTHKFPMPVCLTS